MSTPVWFWNEDEKKWVSGMAGKDDDDWIVEYDIENERDIRMRFKEDQYSMDHVIDRRNLPASPEENDDIRLYKRDISQDNPGEIVGVSPSRETLDRLFPKFVRYLQTPEDNAVKKALKLMFPNSMSESSRVQFITLLLKHCKGGLQLVKTATLPLDPTEATRLAGTPGGEYDRGHAMKIKYYIGMLFSKENGTFKERQTIIEFYTLNQPIFNGLRLAEEQFSEDVAALVDISSEDFIAEKLPDCPLQPQERWTSIIINEMELPYIQVDVEALKFISHFSQYILGEQVELANQLLKETACLAGYFIIKIGMSTIKVSIYTLLWLTKYIYDLATNGRFGSILNRVLEIIYANQEFLFGGPFLNISNPSIDESTRRRLNRIVFTFFYTMVDLLIFTRENEVIIQYLALNTGLPSFIDKDPSTWTLDEIFKYGPELYVAVMEGRGKPEMGYPHNYYDSYYKSIGIVTGLLDTRIFDAKIESLTAILTPLGIAMQAPAISNATPEQIREVQSAIAKLQELGRISGDLEQSLGASGWNLQSADGSASVAVAPAPAAGVYTGGPDGDGSQSSLGLGLGGGGRIKRRRKTTKRSRKSTRRRKSKRRSYKKTSKRKKGHKSKRRSMREVKDKLIHLINSL